MAKNKARIRQALRQTHRVLAPVMALPLLITLTTGILFQLAANSGQMSEYLWLLDIHRGHFGQLNLEAIYPLLNGLGLLTLVVTGIAMWLQLPRRQKPNRR
ncbi:MAG: PepSY domain-containing protein [Leptolyngbya sp. SIO4C1]|nr:PepSY domain-containing protein [Leptolyngbya sp. SIO4C1]